MDIGLIKAELWRWRVAASPAASVPVGDFGGKGNLNCSDTVWPLGFQGLCLPSEESWE